MSEFKCAIEQAKRPGTRRCAAQCQSCLQANLTNPDGTPSAVIETYSGRGFDYANPLATAITLEDVAQHLSLVCRFGGAIAMHYSIAEHAIYTRHLVRELGHPELSLAALHHDTHEYILGDWPTPLKRYIRSKGVTVLDELRVKVDQAIGEQFGVDPYLFEHPVVKRADAESLYREAARLKKSRGVGRHWGREFPAAEVELLSDRAPSSVAHMFRHLHKLDGGK